MGNLAPAAGQAVRIIELLAGEREALGISEISRRLELNKNMVFRVLATLEEAGWVYCEKESDGRYRLSLLPFQVTSRAVRNLPLSAAAAPYVRDLWTKTGESTYLGILREQEVMYIQHLDSVRDVRVAGAVGGLYPLHCTAPGKALLAFSGGEFIEDYVSAGLRRFTGNTITDGEALARELEAVRQRGYATDYEEYGAGILCLAAPIFDYTGQVVGTVGSSFSTVGWTPEKMVGEYENVITDTARTISCRLGSRRDD